MKQRKKKKFFVTAPSTTVSFTELLKSKFSENFTFASFKKDGYWRERDSGDYKNGGFEIQAQVFTMPPGNSKPDVIFTSLFTMKENDKETKELAAKDLVIELRRLGVAI